MNRTSKKTRKRFPTRWLWLLVLVLLLSLHFWYPNLGTAPVHSSYNTGAQGRKAFYLLSDRFFFDVRRLTTTLNSVTDETESYDFYDDDPDTTLCLLGPARYPTESEWDDLLEWVRAGGALLIAARDEHPAFAIDALGIEVESLDDDKNDKKPDDTGSKEKKEEETEQADARPVRTRLMSNADLTWKSRGRIVAPPAADVLLEHAGTIQAVGYDHGHGRVVVVASPFVFTNQSLAWGENGVLASRLLENAAPDHSYILFDESLNRSGTPKAVGLLLDPFLWPVTVQLCILLLLFAWSNNSRFGPRHALAVEARRNIVDHTDTIGSLYYRSRNGSAVLRSYLRQLVVELHLKHFRGREEQVLAPIARRMNADVAQIKKVLTGSANLGKNPRAGRKQVAACIRKLARIRRAARQARRGN